MTINLATQAQAKALSITEANLSSWDAGPDTSISSNLVIEFARARLKHIDSYLNRELATIRDSARDTDAINAVLKELAHYADGSTDGAGKSAIEGACRKAAAELPDGSPLKTKLLHLANDKDSILKLGNDAVITQNEVGSIKTDLEGELKAVDKRSQEDQLLMNAKMGERSEVLQQAANLVQQLNEIIKAILGRG
jgi:hypothetical protein